MNKIDEINFTKENDGLSTCDFKTLAENNITLYGVAKSSEYMVNKTLNRGPFIEYKEGEILSDEKGEANLPLTGNAAILCLEYGDVFVESNFSKDTIPEELFEKKMIRIKNNLDEYKTECLPVSKTSSIKDPDVLKKIIDVSDDDSLRVALNTAPRDPVNPEWGLVNYNFEDSLKFWKNVIKEWNQLINEGQPDIMNALRGKLDEILEETKETIKNEKDAFEQEGQVIENFGEVIF